MTLTPKSGDGDTAHNAQVAGSQPIRSRRQVCLFTNSHVHHAISFMSTFHRALTICFHVQFPRNRRSKARVESRIQSSQTDPINDTASSSSASVSPGTVEREIVNENVNPTGTSVAPAVEHVEILRNDASPLKEKNMNANKPTVVDTPTKPKEDSASSSNAAVAQNVSPTPLNRFAALQTRPNTAIVIENAPVKRIVELIVPDEITELAANLCKINPETDGATARPRICLDINNSGQDMLFISGIPKDMTYDRLLKIVGTFGEIEALNWDSNDPFVCEVIYADPTAAREAIHYLDNAMVGGDNEPPLRAKLRSREPGAQLFVGDLVPSVTEDMLEQAFEKIVGSSVTATLKRDPETNSPIGYGFLSFQSEAAANVALVSGHRMKVGEASIRVGRAERNTHLYVTDLAPEVEMPELREAFGKFGELVDEDTVIVRRSYAFIRFKDRLSAERAKRTLDKTDLKGKITLRYADAEQHKACISVQFHSSVPKPPHSLRDLLLNTFSKYGNCSVEIPRQRNGMWRKAAFVTFHGDNISATLAATLALQNVRFVSTVPVMCQWAREILPRVPPRDLRAERRYGFNSRYSGSSTAEAVVNSRLRVQTNQHSGASSIRPATVVPTHTMQPGMSSPDTLVASSVNKVSAQGDELVPVYMTVSALHQLSMLGGFPRPYFCAVPHSAIQKQIMPSTPAHVPMANSPSVLHPYANPHPLALHTVGTQHGIAQHLGSSLPATRYFAPGDTNPEHVHQW